jgi:hypothetical protein
MEGLHSLQWGIHRVKQQRYVTLGSKNSAVSARTVTSAAAADEGTDETDVLALEQASPGFLVREASARMVGDLSDLVEGTSLSSEFAEIDRSVTALACDAALSKLHELLKQLQRP